MTQVKSGGPCCETAVVVARCLVQSGLRVAPAAVSHSRAVLLMILVTFLWSMAGVVSRHLEAAQGFEVNVWRSGANALALFVGLTWLRGTGVWRDLLGAPRVVWASSLCWAVMYTGFMVALTLTTVANVLIIMAAGPLLTAALARVVLHHPIAARTWAAIVLAGAGIAWIFADQAAAGASMAGAMVALAVPIAASINWMLLQATHFVPAGEPDEAVAAPAPDMMPAVFVGAVISTLATLPLAWPLTATMHDIGLLAFLGVFQLAVPCLLVVRLTAVLPGPEISLLGLLEVIFGVTWTWLGAGESPPATTLAGGALVLAALAGNELAALRARRVQPVAG